ncbi:MAG: hypothetical protein RL137_1655 [Bacteroidota bacterium]|jgi:hypothetical protein
MKKLFLLSSLSLGLLACQKWQSNKENLSIQSTQIENAFDEMTNITDQAIDGALVYYKSGQVFVNFHGNKPILPKTPCNVVITIDTISIPHSLTVDWGSTNCDCNDGKSRRGKIVTTFTGSYLAQGTILTHTPQNYYVNDIQIEGTKTVQNMGLNSNGMPYFNVEIDGQASFPNGETMNYISSRVRTWTSGFNTPIYRWDDTYEITGSATGNHSNGNSFTTLIITPIGINFGCGFPISGIIDLTPSGLPTRTINYGNGTCDFTFTVTVNGNTYTFN